MFDESEAYHIADIECCRGGYDEDYRPHPMCYRSRKKKLGKSIEAPKIRNEKAQVGEECRCPMCGKKFAKKSYQQKFCGIKCKNNYHNKRQYYY